MGNCYACSAPLQRCQQATQTLSAVDDWDVGSSCDGNLRYRVQGLCGYKASGRKDSSCSSPRGASHRSVHGGRSWQRWVGSRPKAYGGVTSIRVRNAAGSEVLSHENMSLDLPVSALVESLCSVVGTDADCVQLCLGPSVLEHRAALGEILGSEGKLAELTFVHLKGPPLRVRATSGRPIEALDDVPAVGANCHHDRDYRFTWLGDFGKLPAMRYILTSNDDKMTPASKVMWELTIRRQVTIFLNFRSEGHVNFTEAAGWLQRDGWKRCEMSSTVSTGVPNGPYSGPVYYKAVENGVVQLMGSNCPEGVYFVFYQPMDEAERLVEEVRHCGRAQTPSSLPLTPERTNFFMEEKPSPNARKSVSDDPFDASAEPKQSSGVDVEGEGDAQHSEPALVTDISAYSLDLLQFTATSASSFSNMEQESPVKDKRAAFALESQAAPEVPEGAAASSVAAVGVDESHASAERQAASEPDADDLEEAILEHILVESRNASKATHENEEQALPADPSSEATDERKGIDEFGVVSALPIAGCSADADAMETAAVAKELLAKEVEDEPVAQPAREGSEVAPRGAFPWLAPALRSLARRCANCCCSEQRRSTRRHGHLS